jgi:Tol biopolymer transport system component
MNAIRHFWPAATKVMPRLSCIPLVLLVVVLAGCEDVLGSGDPAQDQIVFVSDGDLNPLAVSADIFRMNADGTGLVNLTLLPARYEGLDVSPDGSRIAFSSNRGGGFPQIWVVDTDGGNLRQLTTGGTGHYQPRWSPDGAWIAYLGNGVQVMDANGGSPHSVSSAATAPGCGSSGALRLGMLGWIPNGRIAFYLYECGVGAHYFTVRPDGGGLVALDYDIRYGYWSPDGSRIALVDNRNGRLSVMNADGSGLRALTNHAGQDMLAARLHSEYSPWSPDGGRIMFTRWDLTVGYESYVINADGSGLRRVADGVAFSGWSPQGDRFAFLAKVNGDFDVFVANDDGTGAVNLTRSPGRETEPHWVPRR